MITNEQYLIQKYAEAREKSADFSTKDYAWNYWKGVMDTYRDLLIESFPGSTAHGTVGHFVIYEGLTYDGALNAVSVEKEFENQNKKI
jgi:hypothetical protein